MYSVMEIAEKTKNIETRTIAIATGLSFPTVKSLQRGEVRNYTLKTIELMSAYIDKTTTTE